MIMGLTVCDTAAARFLLREAFRSLLEDADDEELEGDGEDSSSLLVSMSTSHRGARSQISKPSRLVPSRLVPCEIPISMIS